MSKLQLFFHQFKSAQYIFQSTPEWDKSPATSIKGRVAAFKDHMFATDHPQEIEELKTLCEYFSRGGQRFIYQNPEKMEVDEDFADPIAQIKKEAREELLKELAVEGKIVKDGGEYKAATNIVPTSTKAVQVVTSAAPSNTGVQAQPRVQVATPKAENIA